MAGLRPWSEDTILTDALVCRDLRTGDVLHLGLACAYTTAYASTFNGFPLPAVITREYVNPRSPQTASYGLALSHA